MSLFNIMQTSVSGMAAQAGALSSIGDNIANSGTTGYKEANTQFQSLLGQSSPSDYQSGGVVTDVRYGITDQGTLSSTTSPTDLAIKGNGFFVVSQNGAGTYLTRAGSFVPDSNGYLVNAAGYQLMGYAMTSNGQPSPTLTPVKLASGAPGFNPSTSGTLAANLDATQPSVTTAANLPSANPSAANAQYTNMTSLNVVDSQGTSETVNVYFTKTGSNAWEVTAYNAAGATNGGFPYAAGSQMGTTNITFNATSGVVSGTPTLNLTMPISGSTVGINLSGMTQLATGFGVSTKQVDGNVASQVTSVTINKDGTLVENYASGKQSTTYEIPLGTVTSPNLLTPLSGNVYQVSEQSGALNVGAAGNGGLGTINSNELEQSTVDLATQLTNMIQAQRAYEANSKVLQAGSDLLSVLNRLSTN